MNAFAFFDRIYVINLDRRPDRWAGITRQMEQNNLADRLTRVAAVDDPGAAGCFASHLKVIDLAIQEGARHPLILEDDAQFTPVGGECLDRGLRELPAKWDFLYLGYSIDRSSNEARAMDYHSPHLLRFPKGCYTTHAYSAHHEALGRLRQDLGALWRSTVASKGSMDLQIDLAYLGLAESYRMFGIYPMLLTQSDGYSDIWNEERKYKLQENIDSILAAFGRVPPG